MLFCILFSHITDLANATSSQIYTHDHHEPCFRVRANGSQELHILEGGCFIHHVTSVIIHKLADIGHATLFSSSFDLLPLSQYDVLG